MTLRDALAAALSTAGVNDDHSPYTAESVADAILSDPAFREALVKAVAEATADVWRMAGGDECSFDQSSSTIVARMLGDEPTGPHPGGIEQYQEEDR